MIEIILKIAMILVGVLVSLFLKKIADTLDNLYDISHQLANREPSYYKELVSVKDELSEEQKKNFALQKKLDDTSYKLDKKEETIKDMSKQFVTDLKAKDSKIKELETICKDQKANLKQASEMLIEKNKKGLRKKSAITAKAYETANVSAETRKKLK